MKASVFVGRVGGLAVALGVGLFAGSGTAWAGPDSSPAPGPSVIESGSGPSSSVGLPHGKALRAVRSVIDSTSPHAGNLRTTLGTLTDHVGAHRSTALLPGSSSSRSTRTAVAGRPPGNALAGVDSAKDAIDHFVAKARLDVTSLPTPKVVVERAFGVVSSAPSATVMQTQSPMSADTTGHGLANVVATAVNRALSPFASDSPTGPLVDSPIALAVLAATRRELSGAVPSLAPSTSSAASSAIVVDGYEIVPSSVEHVISFYGLLITPPALPGSVQGTQEFVVIDPVTHLPVGSFKGFVSNTNSLIIGGGISQQIYVSSVAEGADPAATPPVGTVISRVTFGKAGRFGFLYSAMPSDPRTEISFKLLTPLGDIKIPMPYDATLVAGEVTRPMELTKDYYIAPAPGEDGTLTSVSGVPPLFTDAQIEQVFAVYQKTDDGIDGNDVVIGTFKGYTTTTSDIIGTTTQAVLVTEVLTGHVGTGPGDVPPVGSVYNVIYKFGIFYSSIPSDSGDVLTTEFRTFLGTIKIPSIWSASSPPVYESFSVPNADYSLVPVGTLQPAGVNGLPPAEVQVQGYQRFNVVDSAGNVIGKFDGDVTYQWMPFGIYAEAILVTNVTEGVPGTGAGEVPPVGSQLNFVNTPFKQWGMYYSALPGDDDVLTFRIVTPFGNIPIPARYNAIKGLDDVTYFDPFAP